MGAFSFFSGVKYSPLEKPSWDTPPSYALEQVKASQKVVTQILGHVDALASSQPGVMIGAIASMNTNDLLKAKDVEIEEALPWRRSLDQAALAAVLIANNENASGIGKQEKVANFYASAYFVARQAFLQHEGIHMDWVAMLFDASYWVTRVDAEGFDFT